MEIMSRIYDHRINSMNLYVETTFGEYLSFADKIIKNNELQRKRVRLVYCNRLISVHRESCLSNGKN